MAGADFYLGRASRRRCQPRLASDAETKSHAWAGRVGGARAAIKRTGEPYKQPSQAAIEQAWKDLRTHGKIHCRSDSGNPSGVYYANQREQGRHDNLRCGPRQEQPPVKVSLNAQQRYWSSRKDVSDRYQALAEKHALEAPERVDLAGYFKFGDRTHSRGWLSGTKLKSAKPDRVLPTDLEFGPFLPGDEHGGNVVISRNPQRSNFYGVPGKKIRPDAVISYGIDVGYGDPAPDCVSVDATFRNKGVKKPSRSRREAVDWNWLAQCARAGSSDAYNNILVAARSIAENMERRYNSHSSSDLIGDLVTVGLFGVASKKTGKVSNGVKYAITKWEAIKGSFLPFMATAIRNAMVAYIRAETAKGNMDSVSLNADLPLSEDGDACFQDLITADDVYGVHGDEDAFDLDAATAKFRKMMQDQLTDRQRDIITERYLLNGPATQPNQEELAAKWGVKRQVISKDEIAAKEVLGIKD